MSAVEDLAESLEFNKYLRINGGNRKRGLMAWANSLMNDSDMRDIEMSALETGFMDEGGC